MAVKLGNWVWEGVSTETKPGVAEGAGDGHVFKELDTGESYTRVAGEWQFINLGLSFIRATKSGRITTDASGVYNVLFTTPLIDSLYTVALSVQDGYSGPGVPVALFKNIATTGFTIQTRSSVTGAAWGNVVVSWLTTRDYDP